ncbi:2446_t:CDS:1 [Funneliformis mosseae]|uniref:2446_t:CDS:1 n=1 Tax=Funneliformis mosseae TaxID=27381 RepID=A0A9N8VBY5_FUNMO|nr:2446_t:CDS:1 [Funneliformis mosseae]
MPMLWSNPFKEYQTINSSFKVILPLISYLDKDTKEMIKINDSITSYYIPTKAMFNYASFIKELDYMDMYHQVILCLKKIREDQKRSNLYYEMVQKIDKNYYDIFVELIYKIVINNSRIKTFVIDMFFWRSNDIFGVLLKTPGQENAFSHSLRNFHCKLLAKDVNILFFFLKLANNQIRDLSLSLYGDEKDNISYSSLIETIKSQPNLETLHISESTHFVKLILSELRSNVHSIAKLSLESHNSIEKSGFYFLSDEWGNSLELTLGELNKVENYYNDESVPFSNLKRLKLDWNTCSSDQLQFQESEVHQSIITLIRNHHADLIQLDFNTLTEFHFKNIFEKIPNHCLNLQTISYNIHNLNDLDIIYSIFKNNLNLLSINLNLLIPITPSFFVDFAQQVPESIQNIILRNCSFNQDTLPLFLSNVKSNKLKSFKFIWKSGGMEVYDILKNLYVLIKNFSDERTWTIKDYRFELSGYRDRDVVSFEWEE